MAFLPPLPWSTPKRSAFNHEQITKSDWTQIQDNWYLLQPLARTWDFWMSSLPTAIPSCLCFANCWSTERVTACSKSLFQKSRLREPRGNWAIAKVCCAFVISFLLLLLLFFFFCRLSNGHRSSKRWDKKDGVAGLFFFPSAVSRHLRGTPRS